MHDWDDLNDEKYSPNDAKYSLNDDEYGLFMKNLPYLSIYCGIIVSSTHSNRSSTHKYLVT